MVSWLFKTVYQLQGHSPTYVRKMARVTISHMRNFSIYTFACVESALWAYREQRMQKWTQGFIPQHTEGWEGFFISSAGIEPAVSWWLLIEPSRQIRFLPRTFWNHQDVAYTLTDILFYKENNATPNFQAELPLPSSRWSANSPSR